MRRHAMLAGVAALAVVSCADPTATAVGIAMNASASRNVLTAGASVQITFRLENGTANAITFSANVCPGLLEVVDANDTVVYSSSNRLITCALEVLPVTLQPGESHAWAEEWDGGGINTVTPTAPRVAPGTYRARARLMNFQHLGVIQNNPATIEVR